ncbi:H-NS histone family protein [Burkholderia sp. BCC1998]|uniref:H-NS histone family protein n=1 Tax=Burkholderia sp. BCC1998 TaxID=2817447 RepID=UPI0039EE8C86
MLERRLAVRRLVAEFDIAAREIYGPSPGHKWQAPPARYRDPETDATWNGRGSPPSWINCTDQDSFAIDR